MLSSSAMPRRSACGCFLATEIMFFGGMFLAYLVYRSLVLQRIRRRQPQPEYLARHNQYRRF